MKKVKIKAIEKEMVSVIYFIPFPSFLFSK